MVRHLSNIWHDVMLTVLALAMLIGISVASWEGNPTE